MRRRFLSLLFVLLLLGSFVIMSFAANGQYMESDTGSAASDIMSVNPFFVGTLKTSADGISMLKSMEGYIKKPVGDYQQMSIGYGCNTSYLKTYYDKLELTEDELNLILDPAVPGYILKEEKAEALMMYVLQTVEEPLDAFLEENHIYVNQYQYDALVSFTYNLGKNWMRGGRLADLLIDGNYTVNEFASALGVYCHVTQNGQPEVLDILVTRRIREIKLFLYGAYDIKDVDEKFCRLTYDAGIGSADTDVGFYQVGQPFQVLFGAEPPSDSEETLYFTGWYTDQNQLLCPEHIAQASMTVHAGWSSNPEDAYGGSLWVPGTIYQSVNGPAVGQTNYSGTADSLIDVSTVFSDVDTEDWHYVYVNELYNQGVINGFPDATFRPNASVTTGQALKMILIAAGYQEPPRVDSHWARNFLNLALEEEILSRGDITDLDVPISRKMMAKIVVNALKLQLTETVYFTDTNSVFPQTLYAYGISNGYTDGTFHPETNLSRAELSTIVCRMLRVN